LAKNSHEKDKWEGVKSGELLEAARNDQSAIEAFYKRYRHIFRGKGLLNISGERNQRLRNFLYHQLDELIDDVIGDVIAHFSKGRVNAKYIHPFIKKSFSNRISKLKRTWYRKYDPIVDWEQEIPLLDDIIDRINKSGIWELINKAGKAGIISESSQQVIVLYYKEGWRFREIEEHHGIPKAKTLGNENVHKLRSYLSNYLKGEIDESLL